MKILGWVFYVWSAFTLLNGLIEVPGLLRLQRPSAYVAGHIGGVMLVVALFAVLGRVCVRYAEQPTKKKKKRKSESFTSERNESSRLKSRPSSKSNAMPVRDIVGLCLAVPLACLVGLIIWGRVTKGSRAARPAVLDLAGSGTSAAPGTVDFSQSGPGSVPLTAQPAGDFGALYSLSDAPFEIPPFNEAFFLARDLPGAKNYVQKAGTRHPSGASMMMSVYLPPGDHADGSLPCVLVAPAGTSMIHGSFLDSDPIHPEVMPYVRAGCAAIHYSLDGFLPEGREPTPLEFSTACQQFGAAFGGVKNADSAFRLARTIKQVNPKQIVVAGHSSAATVALLYAAHQPELAGCVAYAPCVDVERHVKPFVTDRAAAEKSFPGVFDFIKRTSPINHTSQYKCPVLVFHSKGDTVTPVSESRTFCDRLKQAGTDVTFIEGTGSDHYETMISDGIPAGLNWLASRAQPAATTAGPSNTLAARTPATAPAGSESPFRVKPPEPAGTPSDDVSPFQPKKPESAGTSATPAVPTPDAAFGEAMRRASGPVPGLPSTEPLQTRKADAQSSLEVGTRVVAAHGLGWLVGEVVEKLPGEQVKVHYLRFPAAFDAALPLSHVRIPLAESEIDKDALETVRFNLNRVPQGGGDAAAKAAEPQLLQVVGYIPGSVDVDVRNKRVSVKIVRGAEAERESMHALIRAQLFVTQFTPSRRN